MPIEWNWIPPRRLQESGTFCRAVLVKEEDLTGGQWRSTSCDELDKNLVTRVIYAYIFSVLFLSKDRGQKKQKPLNAKDIHNMKYRFPTAKDNHFENAIDFVSERYLCKWPNPDDDQYAGRAPACSPIKMCGFLLSISRKARHFVNKVINSEAAQWGWTRSQT